jgi:ankyrin repeat protein
MKPWSLSLTLLAFAVGCDSGRNIGMGRPPMPPTPAPVAIYPAPQPMSALPTLEAGGMPAVVFGETLPVAGEAPAAPAADPTAKYTQRTTQLLQAAEKGRLSLVLELIKQGADVNDKDDQGQTALHKAAAGGHKSIVVSLVTLGADLTERDAQGQTALMAAAASGNPEIVGLLSSPQTITGLAKSALSGLGSLSPDLGGLETRLNSTAYGVADAADRQGRTAAMLAAANGHVDCVSALLSGTYGLSKATMDKVDKQGRNVLMLAAEGGHGDVVDALLHRWGDDGPGLAYLKAVDHEGHTALDLAAAAGHAPVAKLLELELGLASASEGDIDAVKAAAEKFPNELTPPRLMRRASKGGALGLVEHLKAQYKDKTSEEKLRLMSALPSSQTSNPVLTNAVMTGNIPLLKAILDRSWWNDELARKAMIDFDVTGSWAVLKNDYFKFNRIEAYLLVEAARKECEQKPE